MNARWQITIWGGVLLFFAAALYLFSGVLLPFIAGLVLAYLLDPLADRLQRLGLGRLGATILIVILFVLIFVLAIVVLAPLFASQISALVEQMPGYVRRLQTLLVEQGEPLLKRFGGEEAMAEGKAALGDLLGQAGAWTGALLKSVWSGGQAIVGLLSLLVITPVVTFYLLNDWDRMVKTIDGCLPRQHAPTIRTIFSDIDTTMSGFIRGQSLVCLFLAVWYGVGLSLIGLNSGLLIGVGAGLISFIPYVGSLLGLVVSLAVAIAQFWPDYQWVVAVLIVFATGQFLEGNVLSPKLVGESVGLHPVWLMFALLAFGSLFGFLGLLLAVPIAASIGVLIRHGLQRYLASPLYHGVEARPISPQSDA